MANEAKVQLGGVTCRALLDTGSIVSTVSHPFYLNHMGDCTLHPMEDILHIGCAGGQFLPYLGYVEAEVGIPDVVGQEQSAIFLVAELSEGSRSTFHHSSSSVDPMVAYL